jgi:hypothetical protein
MSQVIDATYRDGVFLPDRPPALDNSSRVRLTVDTPIDPADNFSKQQAWAELESIWQRSTLNSAGDRLDRDQLHDRR